VSHPAVCYSLAAQVKNDLDFPDTLTNFIAALSPPTRSMICNLTAPMARYCPSVTSLMLNTVVRDRFSGAGRFRNGWQEARAVVSEPGDLFGKLLRRLRVTAGLTQEELAGAAGLSTRTVSDLERGVNLTARKDTARLLAGALGLGGREGAEFEAAARGRAAAGSGAAWRALPGDIASFTGRRAELTRLTSAEETVSVVAIGGMAGVGKTALAVRAAHQLADRFPDGQLFLPLYGHTPVHQPSDPADALASLLLMTGMDARQIPPGLEARTGLWRDRLAGRRLLLVLDDASGSEQVRPMLPGAPGCLTLITSRRHLTALEGADTVSLDVLSSGDAAQLLVRLAARPGIDAGDPAVAGITRLCGCLPLAVGILARQLHHHPAWNLAGLAAELAGARDRLELMHAENLSVAAAFDLSYADLTTAQQRLFRRLGQHPGADIDAYAAAALADVSVAAASRGLDDLYDQYLLTEPTRGRYRLHDLIREHAHTLAAADQAAEHDAAVTRLLDYYLSTARAADRHFARRTPTGIPAVITIPPGSAPDLSAREDAIAWMEAEHHNLHASVSYAAGHGHSGHTIAIPAAISGYLRIRGHWHEALGLHHMAVTAADDTADQPAAAGALTDLGQLQYVTGNLAAAADSLARALDLHRKHGDQLGEANALAATGVMQQATADYPAATASLTSAQDLYRGLGDQLGAASTIFCLGVVQYLTGRYADATASHGTALRIYRELGNLAGQAGALSHLGTVQMAAGDYGAAIANVNQALALYRSAGDRPEEANALYFIGAAQRESEDYDSAARHHSRRLRLPPQSPRDRHHHLRPMGRSASTRRHRPQPPPGRAGQSRHRLAPQGPGNPPADRLHRRPAHQAIPVRPPARPRRHARPATTRRIADIT
jgi:tetratricopeptide (TPR) repeat protein/transcriptional regulator with XRE-family HTH domain